MTLRQDAESFLRFAIIAGINALASATKFTIKFIDKAIGWHAIFAWLVFTILCGVIFYLTRGIPELLQVGLALFWLAGSAKILIFKKKVAADFLGRRFEFQ